MFRTIVYLVVLIVGLYWVFRKRKPQPFEPKVIDRTLDPDWPSRLIFHGGHRENTREPSKPKMRIVNRTLDPDSPKTVFFLRTGQLNSSEDNPEDDSP